MVVVVGAGATGLGVAWDLSLRGLAVTVIEQGDLAHGTSGRFHGLLHSGARYAVRDPNAARECIQENRILRRIAAGSIEAVGGYFVKTPASPDDYGEGWLSAMEATGIPVARVSREVLRAAVPELHPDVEGGYWVPDGVIHGFPLLFRLQKAIEAHGGSVRRHTRLLQVEAGSDGVRRVRVGSASGAEWLGCDALVNAAGPWAGEVSRLFDDRLPMRLSRGVMIIFAERKLAHVVNRLAPPGDGDILVPHDRVTIWGTTDEPTESAAAKPPRPSETRKLLALGRDLFPDMENWRALRAFCGVRPLYQPETAADSRHVTRDFTVIDHARRGGPAGVVSVVGGKWVTFRLMAEKAGDVVTSYLGGGAPSLTAETPLPPLREQAAERQREPWLCECEQAGEWDLAAWPGATLGEWRTRTWFSMGPCQGTFCVHRVANRRLTTANLAEVDAEEAALRSEREQGMQGALWGDNAREWALSQSVRRQTLGERTP